MTSLMRKHNSTRAGYEKLIFNKQWPYSRSVWADFMVFLDRLGRVQPPRKMLCLFHGWDCSVRQNLVFFFPSVDHKVIIHYNMLSNVIILLQLTSLPISTKSSGKQWVGAVLTILYLVLISLTHSLTHCSLTHILSSHSRSFPFSLSLSFTRTNWGSVFNVVWTNLWRKEN